MYYVIGVTANGVVYQTESNIDKKVTTLQYKTYSSGIKFYVGDVELKSNFIARILNSTTNEVFELNKKDFTKFVLENYMSDNEPVLEDIPYLLVHSYRRDGRSNTTNTIILFGDILVRLNSFVHLEQNEHLENGDVTLYLNRLAKFCCSSWNVTDMTVSDSVLMYYINDFEAISFKLKKDFNYVDYIANKLIS